MFLPSFIDPVASIMLLASFILGLVLHEFSHIAILANRGIREISMGFSISGIWGGFVKADITPETYIKIQLPFYSSGLGCNFLLFLLFLPFFYFNSYLHLISVANFWLLILNGIPAPLMDGGKVFEVTLKRLDLEDRMELISATVMLIWFFIIFFKILIL